ncbi:hypothetical protein C3418_21315 [Aeromonas sp. ASNIH8]|nr:hypothetical protein C3418_21315 [Aeromonas sp. ASNIH8]
MKIATNSYKCRGPLTMITLLVAELRYTTNTATGSCPSSTRAPRAPGHDHQLTHLHLHLDI